MDEAQFDRVMAVNVKGAMFCYKHAASQMIKQGRGGRIVGAASTASKQGATDLLSLMPIFDKHTGMANGAGYCASKFAVRGLTQSAGALLEKENPGQQVTESSSSSPRTR